MGQGWGPFLGLTPRRRHSWDPGIRPYSCVWMVRVCTVLTSRLLDEATEAIGLYVGPHHPTRPFFKWLEPFQGHPTCTTAQLRECPDDGGAPAARGGGTFLSSHMTWTWSHGAWCMVACNISIYCTRTVSPPTWFLSTCQYSSTYIISASAVKSAVENVAFHRYVPARGTTTAATTCPASTSARAARPSRSAPPVGTGAR